MKTSMVGVLAALVVLVVATAAIGAEDESDTVKYTP
jgi:hypothetical protein